MPSGKEYICKYKVETLVLMLADQNLQLDHSNVFSIEYLNDYEFNLRPILKMTLRLDSRRKMWLLRNKRDIKCKLELVKMGMDIENESFVTNAIQVWNKEFVLYFNDEEEASDTTAMETRVAKNEGDPYAANDIQSENLYESENLIDVYLFNQEFLDASKATFNGIFTKNTIQSCVGRILSDTKHKNVLMSKFENDEVYEELIVPALPAYKALYYLDQYYGFYKAGAILYYDIDIIYILNSNGKLTAKQPNEKTNTVFYVTALDQSQPGNGMLLIEGDAANYCSINEQNISPQKPSTSKNITVGSEAKFVVADDVTINYSEANQSYVNQRNENIAYTRKDDNKFTANIARVRMEENECILYINANNLDISAFAPNKVYQVVYDEPGKQQRYGNDTYRLAYAYHCLKLQSEAYLDSSHQIVLKKVASDAETSSSTNGYVDEGFVNQPQLVV